HRLGYHVIGLPMKEMPVHRLEPEHPVEVALHDVMHAYTWPVSWLRQATVLFYDAIRELPFEDRFPLDDQEQVILDLGLSSVDDLNLILDLYAARMRTPAARNLLERYLQRLEAHHFFDPGSPHGGVRLLKLALFRLLGRG